MNYMWLITVGSAFLCTEHCSLACWVSIFLLFVTCPLLLIFSYCFLSELFLFFTFQTYCVSLWLIHFTSHQMLIWKDSAWFPWLFNATGWASSCGSCSLFLTLLFYLIMQRSYHLPSLIGFLTFSSTKVKMQFLGPFQGFFFLRGASGQLWPLCGGIQYLAR